MFTSIERATNVASQQGAAVRRHHAGGREVAVVDGAHWRALGDLPHRRGGRVLAFGQAVDAIVEQHEVEVHIAPDGVHQVVTADRQRIAVARDDPYAQVGPGCLHSGCHRGRAAMDRMDAVGVHVIRKPARAADAGDEHDLLARHAQRRQHFFHLGQNRVVAATGAPAHILVAGKIRRLEDRQRSGNLSAHMLIRFLAKRKEISETVAGLARVQIALGKASEFLPNPATGYWS